MTYAETDLVATLESLTGSDLGALTQEQRDQFDQFHAGGAEAVALVQESLRLRPGMTVLDVGSGFGGPARQVAAGSGCHVVGVDITAPYVDAARALTRAAGLEDRVSFVCGDVASLGADVFDAAYTMHVQMNVEDKRAFFTEIGQRLRPGARLAVFEVCRAGDEEPALPLPWTLDGSDSFLATAEELRDDILAGGFEVHAWVDETAWIRSWFDDVGSRLTSGGSSATLPALLDQGPLRLLNFAIAIAAGELTVHRGSFTAGGRRGA